MIGYFFFLFNSFALYIKKKILNADTGLKLNKRLENNVSIFIVDNCCKWEAKIKGIFGDAVSVKLDPFHAAQRLTYSIRKKHLFFHEICSDIRNLFRQDGDYKEIRKKETASSDIIVERLD